MRVLNKSRSTAPGPHSLDSFTYQNGTEYFKLFDQVMGNLDFHGISVSNFLNYIPKQYILRSSCVKAIVQTKTRVLDFY